MNKVISSILWGLFFSGIGLVTMFFITRTVHLTCERPPESAVSCVLDATFFNLIDLEHKGLRNVSAADIQQRYDEDDGEYTYRVVLQTNQGIVPLVVPYSSGLRTKEQQVAEINAFIQSDAEYFEITIPPGFVGIVVPLVFIIFGPILAVKRMTGQVHHSGVGVSIHD